MKPKATIWICAWCGSHAELAAGSGDPHRNYGLCSNCLDTLKAKLRPLAKPRKKSRKQKPPYGEETWSGKGA